MRADRHARIVAQGGMAWRLSWSSQSLRMHLWGSFVFRLRSGSPSGSRVHEKGAAAGVRPKPIWSANPLSIAAHRLTHALQAGRLTSKRLLQGRRVLDIDALQRTVHLPQQPAQHLARPYLNKRARAVVDHP